MGTTTSSVSDLTKRLSKLRSGFAKASEYQRSDPDFIKLYLKEVGVIGTELSDAIAKNEVRHGEQLSVEQLQAAMNKLIEELSSLLIMVGKEQEEENYEETVGEIVKKFFPKVMAAIEKYKTVAASQVGREVEIDLQVLVGYLTGKPNATAQWKDFRSQEEEEIRAIKPRDEKRDAVIVEWNQLQAVIDGDNKDIQKHKQEEKEEKTSAFKGYLDKAEKVLPGSWADSDGATRLRTAVTRFRQDVANAGWNIIEHTTENFYGAASGFAPDDVLLDDDEREEPAEDHYDIQKLQAIGHGTSHADRIKTYIQRKVAPKAHRAGLDAKNDAVISFVRGVATEWCSAAESSNTGGNPSMVINFSRGDMISTVKDLPDESKTAGLSLDEKIEKIRMRLNTEIRPEQIKALKDTLSNLLQQKENT
jgi:hypothetical protein